MKQNKNVWPKTLIDWILVKFSKMILPEYREKSDIRWQIQENDETIIAQNKSGKLLANILVQHNWPSSRKSFVNSNSFAISYNPESNLSSKAKSIIDNDAQYISAQLLKLEQRQSDILKLLFPKLESGLIDWKKSPFSKIEFKQEQHGKHSMLKLEHIPCGLDCSFCTRSIENKELKSPPKIFYAESLYQSAINLTPVVERNENELRKIEQKNNFSSDMSLHLRIGGDEPANHPDIVSIIALAKLRGYRPLELQTSAVFALQAKQLKMLINAGLKMLAMPIYGICAETHDKIIGMKGHFDRLVELIADCSKMDIQVDLHSITLTTNLHELDQIPKFAAQYNANFIGFHYPRDEGKSRIEVAKISPRLSDFSPQTKKLISLNVPCLNIGDIKLIANDPLSENELLGSRGHASQKSFGKEFAAVCTKCTQQKNCSGVFSGYLAIHGEDEFNPDNNNKIS